MPSVNLLADIQSLILQVADYQLVTLMIIVLYPLKESAQSDNLHARRHSPAKQATVMINYFPAGLAPTGMIFTTTACSGFRYLLASLFTSSTLMDL